MQRSARVCSLAALALGFAPLAAPATPLEVEPFAYPAGSINTANGGTGWGANAWSDPDTDVTLASTGTSLNYPTPLPLTSSGSRIEISATDASAQATRALGTTMNLNTTGDIYYSSALFRHSAVTGQESDINFFRNDDLVVRWHYGITASGAFQVAVDPGNMGQRATSTELVVPGDTYLLVSRIRTGASDQVSLEIYGPGEALVEPATDGDWDLNAAGGSSVTLESVRLDFSNPASNTNEFDELRIGTTFADVVPEPATASLLSAAALPLLARRRRR